MRTPSIRLIIAAIVALIADLVQWVLFPVTVEGVFSPINDILDIFVGGILVSLLGWHWAFLPSAVGKLVPGVDMIPFWSAAVFIAGAGEHYSAAKTDQVEAARMHNFEQPVTGHAPLHSQGPTLTIPGHTVPPNG